MLSRELRPRRRLQQILQLARGPLLWAVSKNGLEQGKLRYNVPLSSKTAQELRLSLATVASFKSPNVQ